MIIDIKKPSNVIFPLNLQLKYYFWLFIIQFRSCISLLDMS